MNRFLVVSFIVLTSIFICGLVFSKSDYVTTDNEFFLALKKLEKTQTGKVLIEKALKSFKLTEKSELMPHLQWGKESKTDIVLTRHFDISHEVEKREREITIYIRKHQSFTGLIMDIAHELTHAASNPEWDPYDPDLTAGKYIKVSLEGSGGELEALSEECQVGLELSANEHGKAVNPKDHMARCERYICRGGHSICKDEILRDFYRVGRDKVKLLRALGKETVMFPYLSEEIPQLYSSTGHSPYPIALLSEYIMMGKDACLNVQKRMNSLRDPASENISASKQQTLRFLAKRCGRNSKN